MEGIYKLMSIWKYKYFVDVVECKSFTQAGKKNYVTQTAISQQIASLEKKIGGPLLERKNGSVTITKLGEIVYRYSKEMLDAHERMDTEIMHFMQTKVIHIGVDTSINAVFLNKLREILNLSYSEDEFTVYKMDSHSACNMLTTNELDLYIGYQLDSSSKLHDLQELELARNKTGVYIGNISDLKDNTTIALSDLENYPQYCTALYPCSMQTPNAKHAWTEVYNVETMNLKVDFNNGYAFVDSLYFRGNDGCIKPLADYDQECILKAFHKTDAPKTLQLLNHLHIHMRQTRV